MEDMNEVALNAVIVVGLGLSCLRKMEKKKERKYWTRPWLERRNEAMGRGVLSMLENELISDPESYKNFLRMDEMTFKILLGKIDGKVQRQDTNMRQCIPARKRLAITLRFLATGESFKSLSFATRIAHSTLSIIIPEVLKAIVDELKEYVKIPTTPDEWKEVAASYEEQWNFPHCVGSMDGKHIGFRPHTSSGSFYRNYKGFDSIVLLAVVDANYKFLCIDVGCNGRISDGGVFKRSKLYQALQKGTLKLPIPEPLPQKEGNIPYVFVSDDAFPLTKNIMKPYRSRGLENSQKIFNYRLSRARRVVENIFGMLSNRFRVLLAPLNLPVEKVELITVASCILHNFILQESPKEMECLALRDGSRENTLQGLPKQCGNRATDEALQIRKCFEDYFNTSGSVPWQQASVDAHHY